jgi:hypothetical protein
MPAACRAVRALVSVALRGARPRCVPHAAARAAAGRRGRAGRAAPTAAITGRRRGTRSGAPPRRPLCPAAGKRARAARGEKGVGVKVQCRCASVAGWSGQRCGARPAMCGHTRTRRPPARTCAGWLGQCLCAFDRSEVMAVHMPKQMSWVAWARGGWGARHLIGCAPGPLLGPTRQGRAAAAQTPPAVLWPCHLHGWEVRGAFALQPLRDGLAVGAPSLPRAAECSGECAARGGGAAEAPRRSPRNYIPTL